MFTFAGYRCPLCAGFCTKKNVRSSANRNWLQNATTATQARRDMVGNDVRYLYTFADDSPGYWVESLNLIFLAEGAVDIGLWAARRVAARAAAKMSANLFGKEVASTTTRMGRDGRAVEVLFKDGSKLDINVARVKEWIPNPHPNAPAGALQKVKFDNFLPGSKGYKRTPTQGEIDFLNSLFN